MNSKGIYRVTRTLHLLIVGIGLTIIAGAGAADQSGTKWSGTWKDKRWGDGKASLVITEDFGDYWEAIWRDGSGIRYRSKLNISKEGGKVTIEGKAKGRIRTISLTGHLSNNTIECTYSGRDCSGTVTVLREQP